MLLTDELSRSDVAATMADSVGQRAAAASQWLQQAFGTAFTVLDGTSGDVLYAPGGLPAVDWTARAELCREVARRGRAELLDEEDPLCLWALPLANGKDQPLVAAAWLPSRPVAPGEDLARAAAAMGWTPQQAAAWAAGQTPWSPDALERMGSLVISQWKSTQQIRALEIEAQSLSVHLSSTYEEICLLHRLTQNLKISESDEDLGRMALEWMEEVLPAAGLALQFVATTPPDASYRREGRRKSLLLTRGRCPLDDDEFSRLVRHLQLNVTGRPTVINRGITARDDWPCPAVRQMIVVPLAEGENLFGWLAAINHAADAEFGTVEASLLSSIAAILGIHSGNIELYRQQSELMGGIVRALTSAIDAKDQYTCGHSDRVARVAVRLAEELGCDEKTVNMIYLAGLLHDIGKIGVDDSVLRKPGKLSDAEYEHIKRHPTIGHKILRDLPRLENILPVILYHHERWDSRGYPQQLGAEQIPLPARIIAVADSFDAMGSDRPYRECMEESKIDEIFRAGAGKQWDARVVEAFFRARDDIRRIARTERDGIQIDPRQWG